MYHFKSEYNDEAFFWFRKELIEDLNWAMLSTSAKAVFPVIGCYINKNGVAFPGEETISTLAGVNPKVVRKGVHDLEGFPGFSWEHYVTKRGRRSKKFYMDLPRDVKPGEAFRFFQVVLESGGWRELKPAAKALYPTMRFFGYFDMEEAMEEGEVWDDGREAYASREYDQVTAERTVMARHAGIDRRSIGRALESLSECHLVDELEDGSGWKVYLRHNGRVFKPSYLNQKVMGKKARS